MGTARPDRVVRTLTALAAFSYFFMWAGMAVLLIGLPIAKAFGGTGGSFYYSLELPVNTPTLQTMVETVWGPAPLMLDEVRGKLQLPISAIPWSVSHRARIFSGSRSARHFCSSSLDR